MLIKENERTRNTVLLSISSKGRAKQALGLAVIEAACVIGKELGHTHFFPILEEENWVKFYFTSNTKDDPAVIFKNELDEAHVLMFKESGFSSIKVYSKFFKK